MRAELSVPVLSENRSAIWWFRWVPTLVLTLLILYFLYVVGSVALVPVLASFALAYLLNPVVSQGEKQGLSRPIATALALLLLTLAAAAFLVFIFPDLWEQSTNAVRRSCAISRRKTPPGSVKHYDVIRPPSIA